jgi:hypothetical protein
VEIAVTQSVFPGLDQATAESEAQFYRDSGATATYASDGAGHFTLTVTYPDTPAPAPAPAPAPPPAPGPAPPPVIQAPQQAGFVLAINRIRCEFRPSVGYARTVGVYQGFLNGSPVAGVQGYCVERQGPGDNTQSGVDNHRRIAAGTYPLFTHGDNGRYRTIGYATPGAINQRPWPCIGVENTGARSGILIHCAAGYLMSIGCINLTSNVVDESTNLDFGDSWNHVTQLINAISANTPGFPAGNNAAIPNCTLVITGEPDLGVDDALKAAIVTAVRMNEIGSGSPYVLCFAGKGNSGASFGATQGDLAAGQPIVQSTFRNALAAAGFSAADIQQFTAALSVHLLSNPLSAADTQRINAALLNSKNLVDNMDQQILAGVYSGLDQCIAAASSAGRQIEPIALIYMALWINMSGPPTALLDWLKGPTQDGTVTEGDIKSYLSATSYFTANPGNLPHIIASAQAGELQLQQSGVA